MTVKRTSVMLIVLILLLAALAAGCGVEGGGDSSSVNTPVPPAQRTGMDAINGLEAAGQSADCSHYPQWLECK